MFALDRIAPLKAQLISLVVAFGAGVASSMRKHICWQFFS
jgi:hypothetical protein